MTLYLLQTVSYTHLDVYKRQVDYRSFTITAETAGDTASLAAAKTKADAMAAAVTDEASFAQACTQ